MRLRIGGIATIIIIIIISIIGLFVYSATRPGAVAQRALGNSSCEPTSVNVDFGPQYTGTLIDTHIHLPDDQMEWLVPFRQPRTISDYVCTFTQEGTSRVFAFFPIYPGLKNQQFAIVQAVTEKYPNLFVPFIMPPDNDDSPDGFPTVSADVLASLLDKAPRLFAGYGEIGLYERGDHGGSKGAPALLPDSPRMQAIYPVVREHNLLVYVHLGEGQQASFERAVAAHPDISFIFHGDQLVQYENGVQNLTALDEILSRHPNVYYGVDELYGDKWLLQPEVSKEEFLAHFENYEELLDKDVATWKAFIERNSNQVLWGTDRGWFGGWALDPEVGVYLTRYARAFITRLPPAVQEKFAYKNAERLLSKR
ncbi:MAG TPA: amidohydrolase family protein [Candidatus Andersenbacteria bacterium]|nr:amidohydrolase family protein [Candidatus Andersenbacteria bacterium]